MQSVQLHVCCLFNRAGFVLPLVVHCCSPPRRGAISRNCPLSEQLRRHVPRQPPTGVSNVHHASPLSSRYGNGSLMAARAICANGNGIRSTPATPAVPQLAESAANGNGAAANGATPNGAGAARPSSVTPPARRVKLFGTPPPASLTGNGSGSGGGGGGSGRGFSARIAQQQQALAASAADAAAAATNGPTAAPTVAQTATSTLRTSPRRQRASFKQLF